jgi:hypothetical protein
MTNDAVLLGGPLGLGHASGGQDAADYSFG